MVDFAGVVVDEAVASYFADEPWEGEYGHDWHRSKCLLDFEPHLVLEVFWMLEGCLVEDEEI